jgi:trimeric autotransporter adhesin
VRHKGLTASMVMLAVGIALSVWGDPTALSISNGSVTVTSSSSTTLNFPISRSGDTSYDAFVQYQTQDGTALAGVDYTAASGSVVIPAGASSATIPVTIAGSTSNPPDKTFQMQLLGGGGAARTFTASFAAQQPFATGSGPAAEAVADINGDGKADLIVVNQNDGTVSVLLNTTAPGAITPSFATQQTFAVGANPQSIAVADVNGDGKPPALRRPLR